MVEKWLDVIDKAAGFLLTPLAYRDFARLYGLTFSNRRLIRELVHLQPHRPWFRTQNFATILDVGAFIGTYAFAMKHILPEAQVYSFEPLPASFAALIATMKPFPKWQGFNTAIGDSTGSLAFWENEFSASSSALPMEDLHRQAFPQTKESRQVTVPVTTLDEMAPQLTLTGPVLLKIDVQGYELAVLRGAKNLLNQIDCVVCEVSYYPLYKGQSLFPEVYRFMQEAGFGYRGSLENLVAPA
ncbi:MAG: FkbM family methyltransferase, partial [Anaerolineaceae bacterium]